MFPDGRWLKSTHLFGGRQGEGDITSLDFSLRCRGEAGLRRRAENDELPATDFVDGRYSFERCRDVATPQYLAGLDVESAYGPIPRSREENPTGRNYGSDFRVVSTRVLNVLSCECRNLTESYFPFD